MVDFSDVIEFARVHYPCGGVAPTVRPEASGGYLLTLTCACGIVLDRQVTADEAAHVPFASASLAAVAPATTAPRRPARSRPRPTPSPELERAMREALEAEDAAASAVTLPQRETRRIAASQALEDVLRAALAAEDAAAAAPAPNPRVAPLAASKVQETVSAALREQRRLRGDLTPQSAPTQPRSRALWLGLAFLLVSIGAAAALYVAETLEFETPVAAVSRGARPVASAQSVAPTYGNAVIALRRMQAASVSTISLPAYEVQVDAAQGTLGRYMESEAPSDAKHSLRAILDLHMLALTAWRVRAVDTPQAWEPVSRSPALELCAPVQSAADIAERSGERAAQSRGRAIAASIPLLWECAASRLAQLDAAR